MYLTCADTFVHDVEREEGRRDVLEGRVYVPPPVDVSVLALMTEKAKAKRRGINLEAGKGNWGLRFGRGRGVDMESEVQREKERELWERHIRMLQVLERTRGKGEEL